MTLVLYYEYKKYDMYVMGQTQCGLNKPHPYWWEIKKHLT